MNVIPRLGGPLRSLVFMLVIAGPVHGQDADTVAGGAAEQDFHSSDPIPLIRMSHAEANIEIDGLADEPAWAALPVQDEFRVLRPDTLEPGRYRTAVRFFYTEVGLYISFDLEQPRDSLIRRYTARDVLGVNRDYISVTVDTSGEGRYGYWMNIALGGNQTDGTILPERQYSQEWDGAWYGATQTTDTGWSAELFLPWSQMAMVKAEDRRRIGIYTSRRVAHLNETWGWPTLPRSQPRFLTRLQKLELYDVDPRRQWSLFPYASSTYDRIDENNRYKGGFDLFWRPSSNLQLNATVNPDFGTVESDDVIVNLTADETFFPEKRLFFLEGQEIFKTTPRADPDSEQALMIVNTRRIGGRPPPPELPAGVVLPARELLRPTELIGAARTTGQAGSIRYGFLGAWEDETAFAADGLSLTQDGRIFGAVRVLYEDSHNAALRGLGFITTKVSHPESDATVHGVDFHYLTNTGLWKVDGQLLYSNIDDAEEGLGAFTDVTFTPRQGMKHTLSLTVFDDEVDVNDLGFQIRNDIKEAWYGLEWIESDLSLIRDFTIAPYLRYQVNGEGYRTNVALGSSFDFNFNNLDRVSFLAAHLPPQFDDRNSFGNGTFEVASRDIFSVEYRTNTARPVSLLGKIGYREEAVDGYSVETGAGIFWRPLNRFNLELLVTHLDRNGWLLHQENEDFTDFDASQWQPQLILEFFPSAMQQFRLVLQWAGVRAEERRFYRLEDDGTALIPGPKPPGPSDDFSLSQLNFQMRYRWQIAPLSDLFIVYTKVDTRRAQLTDFGTLFRQSWDEPLVDQLVVKLRYRFGS